MKHIAIVLITHRQECTDSKRVRGRNPPNFFVNKFAQELFYTYICIMEQTKIKYTEQIKDILVALAVEDKLPMDMTTLDSSVFDKVVEPLISTLNTLRNDAEMALNGEWDRTDSGFEAQIILIDDVL